MNTQVITALHSSDSGTTAERGSRATSRSGARSRWLTRFVSICVLVAFAAPAVAGHDAITHAYDDGKTVATAKFVAGADRFEVTKVSHTVGHRAYLEYKYIRSDGTLQEGTHWGSSTAGRKVSFDHNFGPDRKVVFRVCVQVSFGFDICSEWETGYAG